MHRSLLALALAGGLLAVPAQAQCSSLAVTGGAPGSALTFSLTGASANAPAVVFVSKQTGSFSFSIGRLGTLNLGLEPPLFPVLLGRTDGNGDASLSINVPSQFPLSLSLFGQGTTIVLSMPPPMLQFCESNVVSFTVG